MIKLGSIETGGTKIVCGIGNKYGEILDDIEFPTKTPEETIPKIIEYFKNKDIEAIGIGSFGPIDTNKNSVNYGKILNTPKISWQNYNIIDDLKKAFPSLPMELVSDVEEAAIGEYYLGVGKDKNSLLYITIGTGIGGGFISNNSLIQGKISSEMGHIGINKLLEDNYTGSCPFHGDKCFEGLASGTAIEGRWGKKGIELVDEDDVWNLEAEYISQGLMNYMAVLMPEIIVLGGGVMKQKQLFPLIKKKLIEKNNGYIDLDNLDIVYPGLKDRSGIIGGLILANSLL